MSEVTASKLPEQWYVFVRGLTRLYKETGLRLDGENNELYAPRAIDREHCFPMPIWQYSDPDNLDSIAGEYLSPDEIERRENEARRKVSETLERAEFERLKAKFEGAKS